MIPEPWFPNSSIKWNLPVSVTNKMTISPSESMPAQIPPGESFATGGGGGGGAGGGGAGGGEVAAGPPDPPPPPPQATQNAVKLNTQRNLANAFMLLVQVRRQPGDLRVLRGVIRGFSEEARTRGFPSPPFGGFGYIGVAKN
jgi:hypothetical protein